MPQHAYGQARKKARLGPNPRATRSGRSTLRRRGSRRVDKRHSTRGVRVLHGAWRGCIGEARGVAVADPRVARFGRCDDWRGLDELGGVLDEGLGRVQLLKPS